MYVSITTLYFHIKLRIFFLSMNSTTIADYKSATYYPYAWILIVCLEFNATKDK